MIIGSSYQTRLPGFSMYYYTYMHVTTPIENTSALKLL